MIREVQAKVLLSRVKGPDPWFGLYYSMRVPDTINNRRSGSTTHFT
jgi:hypothetical protein